MISSLLDDSLGLSDKLLGRTTLSNGHTFDNLSEKVANHWKSIDDVRPGDILVRLCASSWTMDGSNGRLYSTSTDRLYVNAVGPRGYVDGMCNNSYHYGRVPIAEFLFDIVE